MRPSVLNKLLSPAAKIVSQFFSQDATLNVLVCCQCDGLQDQMADVAICSRTILIPLAPFVMFRDNWLREAFRAITATALTFQSAVLKQQKPSMVAQWLL